MEQIVISNITMTHTLTPIFIRLGERRNPPAGILRDVVINNIVATGNSLMSCSITGIPGNHVENIKISNVILNTPGGGRKEHTLREIPEAINSYPENKIFGPDLPAYGFFIRHASNIELNNIQFNVPSTDNRYAVYMEDCKNVGLNQVLSRSHKSTEAFLKVVNTQDLFVSGFHADAALSSFIEVGGNISSSIKLTGNDFTTVKDLFQKNTSGAKPVIMETGNFLKGKLRR
jgi:hypothetical protein